MSCAHVLAGSALNNHASTARTTLERLRLGKIFLSELLLEGVKTALRRRRSPLPRA
jgi:hypothetical protein